MTNEPQPQGQQDLPMPLFYQSPVPISVERHKTKRIKGAGYGFAKNAQAVPIGLGEFSLVQAHYPIIFVTEPQPSALAVLAVQNGGGNLFVNDRDEWRTDVYIPAYVRRYPFIFAEGGPDGQIVLCVDEAAPHISDDNGTMIFDDQGQPTDMTKNMLQFAAIAQREFEGLRPFASALLEKGILESRRIDITLAVGGKLSIEGFHTVTDDFLGKLDDATIIDWVKRGYWDAIAAHRFSMARWNDLAQMAVERQQKAQK